MKFNISFNSSLPPLMIIKDHLDKYSISYTYADGGEIETHEELSEEHLSRLEIALSRYGIELLSDEKSRLVQRIKNLLMELVYDNKHQQKTLSHYLTEKLGFSYGYISGVFAQQTYSSIEKYIIMLKTERAKRLIIEDEVSLKEISNLLSYSSVGHFSKQFKKTTGITISAFKKIVGRRKKAK
jgi:AraC-like DNA-binding protein